MEVDGDKALVRFGHARNQWRRHVSRRSYDEHGIVGVSLDELLARLLQYALLKIGPLAEELLVCVAVAACSAYLIAASSMVQM